MKGSPAAQVDLAARRALRLSPGNADGRKLPCRRNPVLWRLARSRAPFRYRARAAPQPSLHLRKAGATCMWRCGRMRKGPGSDKNFQSMRLLMRTSNSRYIYSLWFLNRIEAADQVADRAMQMWPQHPGIWFGKLWLLTGTGRLDRALVHLTMRARPKLPPTMVGTLRAAVEAAISRRPEDIDAATKRVMVRVEQSVAAVVNAMSAQRQERSTQRRHKPRAYYLERGPIIAAMRWRPGQPIVQDQRRRKSNMLFTPGRGYAAGSSLLTFMDAMGLSDIGTAAASYPTFLWALVPKLALPRPVQNSRGVAGHSEHLLV